MTTTQDAPAAEDAKEIGRDRRRKEDQRLITGRTRWTDNITLNGMLHLAMVRSPFAHANITAINVDEAKAAPNVVTVITGKDIAEEQGSLPNVWPTHARPGHAEPPPGGRGPGGLRGEIVAVVVARSAAEARDAAELVDVDYEELPAALDLKEAAADTVLAHPDLGTNKSAFWKLDSGEAGHGRQRRRGHREGPRRRHRDRARVPPAAADPGVHGAALHGRGPHRRADHDVVLDADPAHPAVLPGRRPRHLRVEGPGDRAGRRRRFRRQAPDHAGGVHHDGARPPAGQAGEVHRDPLGVPDGRPPRS